MGAAAVAAVEAMAETTAAAETADCGYGRGGDGGGGSGRDGFGYSGDGSGGDDGGSGGDELPAAGACLFGILTLTADDSALLVGQRPSGVICDRRRMLFGSSDEYERE
ncbi:unnamed protein product [Rhizoctonia solani]|uniref:Uncharacterized protein n=1 Tax=Rhizoctonia solani TaxID=456999 RepID=A0A8H3A135_9AGAM|nr:unnamed protein product [Rhizoctonia solani]